MAAKKRMQTSKRTKRPTVTVKLDPAQKKAYELLVAKMAASARDEARGFDDYWESVAEVLDRELYIVGGFAKADDFLEREVNEPRRTAYRNIRIARYATPADVETHGPTLLDAALTHIEALTGGPVKAKLPIRFDKMRFTVERDGEKGTVGLADVTVEEVTRATKLLRSKGKGRARPSPNEEIIARALRAIPSLATITISVSAGELRLGGIPLAALGRLATALARIKLVSPGAEKPTRTKASKRTSKPKKRPQR
jgi:hypothetical protein